MKLRHHYSGFTLVEVLIASTLFSLVMISITELFSSAMDLQRRAGGYQKIQENTMFALESIAREVRVSAITSVSGCSATLTMTHPVNGTVTYAYDAPTEAITRVSSTKGGSAAPITSDDVQVTQFQFCVAHSEIDNAPTRVTIPMTIKALSGKGSDRVAISLQTMVVSRDITEELKN